MSAALALEQLELFPAAAVAGVRPIAPAMLARIFADPLAGFAHDPRRRGYVGVYCGPSTACPGCARSNWIVGRQLAECGFCAAALPLAAKSRDVWPWELGE